MLYVRMFVENIKKKKKIATKCEDITVLTHCQKTPMLCVAQLSTNVCMENS